MPRKLISNRMCQIICSLSCVSYVASVSLNKNDTYDNTYYVLRKKDSMLYSWMMKNQHPLFPSAFVPAEFELDNCHGDIQCAPQEIQTAWYSL